MRLPKFKYFEPRDLKEALAILNAESSVKILAGGTDLLVNMKHRIECPATIVNIKRIESLNRIQAQNGDLKIGALTPLKGLQMAARIPKNLPGLAQAAASVGSYHHQVMGTLGGNLCQQNRCKYYNQSQWWRSSRPTCFKAGGDICHVMNKKEICYSAYCGDMAPALMVLNARVCLEGPDGTREIPIAEFFSGDGKAPLVKKQGEILTAILIPKAATEGISVYVKFANRESIDFAIVGIAFWAGKKNKAYRVAFTAVDRKPVRAAQVEDFLNGQELSEDIVRQAAAHAAKAARPVKTSVCSPSHKRRMMGMLLQRAVKEAKRRSA